MRTLAFVAFSAVFGVSQAGARNIEPGRCLALTQLMSAHWPDSSMRILSAVPQPQQLYSPPTNPGGFPPPQPITLPEHCEAIGILRERTGIDGQSYAIRFHLRLPTQWNGRFFYQGGGGSNGVVGDALGPIAAGIQPAIVQGFAVVSQDTGHDNATDSDPKRGGAVAFGFDPEARANYGFASLKIVADSAKAIITSYYRKAPRYSYFVGCSKGGQEGMAFAQRYPGEFSGIVAGAPGFSLPRAAVAEAWDVQAIAAVVATPGEAEVPIAKISSAFSDADLALVREAILSACDADDGLKDGIVNALAQCTDAKVFPSIDSKVCTDAKTPNCISAIQAQALRRIYGGVHDRGGKALYKGWQWDPGIAGPGWRIWKMGSADGRIPALNVALGGASLAAVFTTPPTPVSSDLQSALDFQMRFDFEQNAARIYARDATFKHSAWDDISARSSDLREFIRDGGKLIVPHGVSDPVFSVRDTLSWFDEVQRSSNGKAQHSVRVFPVPGMAHCGGGPATDRFNAFAALQEWVEHQRAPDRILASAGPGSPWPGRTRPLCPYPAIAQYNGSGNIESADSFVCR